MADVMVRGFADPALDAQSVFRLVLDAMARPGRVQTLDDARIEAAPGGLGIAGFAVALALLDFETPVWLDPKLAGDRAVVDAIRFHCGCPIIEDPASASFALLGDAEMAPPLSAFHQGMPEYPDRSTTLIVQVQAIDDAGGVRLTGPGIETESHLAIDGLAADFWRQWGANHRHYPLGVDLILTSGDRLAALPRSISVEV